MSIIFDFKAIRQDAAALGIRAIGEDDLPKFSPEPQAPEEIEDERQPVNANSDRAAPRPWASRPRV